MVTMGTRWRHLHCRSPVGGGYESATGRKPNPRGVRKESTTGEKVKPSGLGNKIATGGVRSSTDGGTKARFWGGWKPRWGGDNSRARRKTIRNLKEWDAWRA